MTTNPSNSKPPANMGFSLVELMISLTIGIIIINGVIGVFISQNKLQGGEANRSELLSDLQLSSTIIQSELRHAQDVYTCSPSEIRYRPLDSTAAALGAADCANTVDTYAGQFLLVSAGASGCSTSSTPCIDWKEYGKTQKNEMIRSIKANTGLNASVDAYGVYTIRITGQFLNRERNLQDLTMDTHVWPRN